MFVQPATPQTNAFASKTESKGLEVKLSEEDILLKEVDYIAFQTKALTYIEKNYNDEKIKEWQASCEQLKSMHHEKSEKLIILKLSFRFIKNTSQKNELHNFITLAMRLKEVLGIRFFHCLFTKEAAENDRHIDKYLAICQLLLDLNEMPGLFKSINDSMPNLSLVIETLQKMHVSYLDSKFPEDNIDETITKFDTKNNDLRFPLLTDELAKIKLEYLSIRDQLSKIKMLSDSELKDRVSILAKEWCTKKNETSKHQLIAIFYIVIYRTYKIAPYSTQIVALLALINTPEKLTGRLAQIKTGEGKSTIIAMLTAWMGCQGQFVDVITSSKYLAKRDCKKYTPFFNAVGLSASHISVKEPKQEDFHGQILYGTNTDFEFALLRDGLYNLELRHSYRDGKLQPRTFDAAIIDEVDNLFLDTALNSARIAMPIKEEIAWIYDSVIKFVKEGYNPFLSMSENVHKLRLYLDSKHGDKHKDKIIGFKDFRLKTWLQSAQCAIFEKKERHHYVVNPAKNAINETDKADEIVIMDYANTGDMNEGSEWQHGLQQFLQTKHGLKNSPESMTAASITHSTYFRRYRYLLGVTGTMGEDIERQEIQKIYNVDSIDIPSHFRKQKMTPHYFIVQSDKEHYAEILKKVSEMKDSGRPILLLFKTVESSNAFSQFLHSKGLKHQLLNKTQKESEEYIVSRAGSSGMITVATNVAGRGTDILLSPQSIEAGGLYVLFTFYPDNLRVEDQGYGRTTRQNQPGNVGMILRLMDDFIKLLLKTSPSLYTKEFIENVSALAKCDKKDLPEKILRCIFLLNQMRTLRIKQQSEQRYHCSQIESLYYDKLKIYFDEIKQIHTLFNDKEFKEACKNICEHDCSIEEKLKFEYDRKDWTKVQETAMILIDRQLNCIKVDWSGFFEQFKHTYISMLQLKWASFYCKLQDEGQTNDIRLEKRRIDESYAKARIDLDVFLYRPKESAINFLKLILNEAKRDLVPKQSEVVSDSKNVSSLKLF